MLRAVGGERSDWEAEEERLATAGRVAGDPTGWFDDLYGAGAAGRISVVADLLDPPDEWTRAFDLVVEIITAQSLPEPHPGQAIVNIGRFAAPCGVLFVVAAIHDNDEVLRPADPFPLGRDEVEAFAADGLTVTSVAQLTVPGQSGAVRWQAEFVRPPAA